MYHEDPDDMQNELEFFSKNEIKKLKNKHLMEELFRLRHLQG